MRHARLIPGLFGLCLSLCGASAESAEGPSLGERLFALHIKGLLAEKCLACHGDDPAKLKGGLDLRDRDKMLAGGENRRQVLVPGDAQASALYRAATWEDPDLEMPPKENDRLSEAQLGYLRDWIDSGAPWPADAEVRSIRDRFAEGVQWKTSGGLTTEWSERRYREEDLWAYRARVTPPVPVSSEEPGQHPVDAFIARHQHATGVSPAPLTNRTTLLRRATYGLTGLPPTPEETRAFLQDPRNDDDAFAAVIDRLLDSPHYGEQMARRWLDVVRYADSSGFANDFERPNTWRYRDYVVRAFNTDKSYAEFVREQLAGDEIDPGDSEKLIAAGFLRMGPWEQTGMSVAKITRQQFLDDVTDNVGQVFLAHSLQCARCHDHKFDPVPTRDYYSIQAVFATTQFVEREASWLPEENTEGFAEQRYLKDRIKRYQGILTTIRKKTEKAARAWYAERDLPYLARSEALKRGLPETQIVPARLGLAPQDLGMERIGRKTVMRHRWELDRYQPIAFSVYSGKTVARHSVSSRISMPADPAKAGVMERTAILTGGDPFSQGEPVKAGVLSAVELESTQLPQDLEGRRLAFAQWVTHPEHPLTARVMVNRLWSWHFGKAIAGNPNNFGATGKKPTHPELLDWLADAFVRSGWSIKDLHRLILTSKAYQRHSEHSDPDELKARDPHGNSYATFTPRRLEAEEYRDSMLAVSGELNPKLGGIPVRPNINREAALQPRMIMGTYAPAYQPSPEPAQRNRRSLYALKLRGLRDPFMEVFNQPGPDKSCELRETSTVTPQVFSLINGENIHDRALALAHRVSLEETGDREILHRLFQLVYQRPPSPEDVADCLEHWHAMTSRHEQTAPQPRPFPRVVVRQAKEEVTGESFEFVEELEIADDYVPDLQAHQVDARTRALADICLILLNSNEFAYVY